MTDKEKETIEQLRSWKKYIIKHKEDVNKANDIEFYLRTAINLIEKQQKEIEELKKYEEGYKLLSYSLDNYTNNDKIKAKIEELDKEEKEKLKGTKGQDRYAIKQEYMYKRSGLQSLLEKE